MTERPCPDLTPAGVSDIHAMGVILSRWRRVSADTVSKDPPDRPARRAEATGPSFGTLGIANDDHNTDEAPDRLPLRSAPGNPGDPQQAVAQRPSGSGPSTRRGALAQGDIMSLVFHTRTLTATAIARPRRGAPTGIATRLLMGMAR